MEIKVTAIEYRVYINCYLSCFLSTFHLDLSWFILWLLGLQVWIRLKVKPVIIFYHLALVIIGLVAIVMDVSA